MKWEYSKKNVQAVEEAFETRFRKKDTMKDRPFSTLTNHNILTFSKYCYILLYGNAGVLLNTSSFPTPSSESLASSSLSFFA